MNDDDLGKLIRLHFHQAGAIERRRRADVVLDDDAERLIPLQQLLLQRVEQLKLLPRENENIRCNFLTKHSIE